ncbi:MAG: chromate transporter [Kiritimatiellae bacterium]|nr:chromate transporter [Kiritimatiellia bacterium]
MGTGIAVESASARAPTVGAIFISFVKIGALLIGGGYAMLPLLEDEMVRRRKWATSDEMADFFALAQVLPGVIAVNTAMLVGNRLRGLAGNLAASLGLLVVPFSLIVAYAIAYASAQDMPAVMRVLEGVRPAVAGMMLGMGLNMMRKSARTAWALAVAVGACGAVLLWNPPMAWMILAAIGAGLVWNWFAARKGGAGC